MSTTRTSTVKDPKPQLGRAAIMANISYCQAQQDLHLNLVRDFEKKELEYVEKIVCLNRGRKSHCLRIRSKLL